MPSVRRLEDVAALAAPATGAAPASLVQSPAVTYWGVASRLVDEAIELCPTREQAEATLEQMLCDGPLFIALAQRRVFRARSGDGRLQ